jgi:hypothetical protein
MCLKRQNIRERIEEKAESLRFNDENNQRDYRIRRREALDRYKEGDDSTGKKDLQGRWNKKVNKGIEGVIRNGI